MSTQLEGHTSKPNHLVPSGAWGSHMHVCEPTISPLDSSAKYQPHAATLAQARSTIADRLGIPCLLHALKIMGPRNGRGVVVFDPWELKINQLKEWHALGVRGVRVNLKSVKKVMTPEDFRETLESYAAAIRPMMSWVLQIYVDLAMMTQIEPLMPHLGIKGRN